jgi:proteic killer suppression protein
MIVNFADKNSEAAYLGKRPKGIPTEILPAAIRKLRQLDTASYLSDLRSPPGNRLHALVGNRSHQHAIRINDQWRICFTWVEEPGEAPLKKDVEITDYH